MPGAQTLLGLTKQAMYRVSNGGLLEAIEYEASLQRQTIVSEDHIEGVAACMEKRPASFRGR